MTGKVLFAALVIVTATSTVAQPMPGTQQEQAACRPDTRRFCIKVKPEDGPFAYLACLQAHRAKLTRPCKLVLESHGQ
jgi:hypothetical protein